MSIEGHRQGHFLDFLFFFRFCMFCAYTRPQISGERLQDHWSSGLINAKQVI